MFNHFLSTGDQQLELPSASNDGGGVSDADHMSPPRSLVSDFTSGICRGPLTLGFNLQFPDGVLQLSDTATVTAAGAFQAAKNAKSKNLLCSKVPLRLAEGKVAATFVVDGADVINPKTRDVT